MREYNHRKELSEKLMDVDDVMKDTEAEKTIHDDDDDDNMCYDETQQEPPDHIKLVMEVGISALPVGLFEIFVK